MSIPSLAGSSGLVRLVLLLWIAAAAFVPFGLACGAGGRRPRRKNVRGHR